MRSNKGARKSNVVIHRGCFPVLWEASIFIFGRKIPSIPFDTKGIIAYSIVYEPSPSVVSFDL